MYKRLSEPGDDDGMNSAPPQDHEQRPQPYAPVQQQPMPGYTNTNVVMQQGQPTQQPMPQPSQMHSSNTTVVIQPAQTQYIGIPVPRDWSSSLCSCFDDCGDCVFSCLFPGCHACYVSSVAGECFCIGVLCPIALRTKIRMRHNIAGSVLEDGCTMLWCGHCAMCQMSRELKLHGI
ncbi:placenta-specific gene 8 protein-like [Dendronephthya gigantea]|uniref:placenta-specific gene 8 protein-like n=1 Tax=Dendronephthya gigantea TaxID=151771 RepID=UPI00106C5337|nr:placenta-specific gene 8 protein-like [Dendronephthya gigantea]